MNSNYNSESSLLDDPRVNTIKYVDDDTKYINISENEKANREILKRSSWWHSSAVIIAEIMGTGVMGLPFAAAGLGWILGMSSVFIFAISAIYSGILLSRIRNWFYSDATSYSEVATAVSGYFFGEFTRWCIYINWAMLLPFYLMAAVSSMIAAFPDAGLCYHEWALIMMVVIIIPSQLRTLHQMNFLVIISDCCVVVALTIIVAEFAVHGRAEDVDTDLGPPSDENFINMYGNLSSFVFAYQGQSMFLEIMREMKKSRQFPKSVSVANMIMCVVYGATTGLSYYYKGSGVNSFLPFALQKGIVKTIVGLLLCYHIIVSYLVTGMPLMFSFHEMIWPNTLYLRNSRSKVHWAIITGSFLVLSYFIANLIPFFSDFQNIIGSALGAPILFGWPAFFFLRACYIHNKRISWFDLIICCFFLFIMLPSCVGLGLYSAITSLISNWKRVGKPFQCILQGF